MVDFYIEEHKKNYPDQAVPEEATVKRQSVVEEFRRLQEETKPLLDIFAEPSVTQQVRVSGLRIILLKLRRNYRFQTEIYRLIDTFPDLHVNEKCLKTEKSIFRQKVDLNPAFNFIFFLLFLLVI